MKNACRFDKRLKKYWQYTENHARHIHTNMLCDVGSYVCMVNFTLIQHGCPFRHIPTKNLSIYTA